MATGSSLCLIYLICKAVYKDFFLNGTLAAFYATLVSLLVFVVLSYLTRDPKFNLDKMLNRNKTVSDPSVEYL